MSGRSSASSVGINLFQYLIDPLNINGSLLGGSVNNMQQQSGRGRFFKGRAKRIHQTVRQMTDKPYCIRKDHRTQLGQIQTPHSGVEGGEELIGGKYIGTSHTIKQCRFAGIGIAHQRHCGNLCPVSGTTALTALLSHLLQALFDRLNTLSDHAPVRFQLGFTRATHAYTAFFAV